jgi:hypothetical protein
VILSSPAHASFATSINGWPLFQPRHRRYRILRQVKADGVLEIRRLNTYGNKVEYRLNPNWAKPKAEVVDLAAVRKARKRAR